MRVIAATDADLGALVAAGRFRQDLLFCLNTIERALSPLSQRGDDILRLTNYFLAGFIPLT